MKAFGTFAVMFFIGAILHALFSVGNDLEVADRRLVQTQIDLATAHNDLAKARLECGR